MKFTFAILALSAVAAKGWKAQGTHLNKHHAHHAQTWKATEVDGDEDMLIQAMPLSIPFHSDVPISEAYQKLLDSQQGEAETLRKQYNTEQKEADDKARAYKFKYDEAAFAHI